MLRNIQFSDKKMRFVQSRGHFLVYALPSQRKCLLADENKMKIKTVLKRKLKLFGVERDGKVMNK